MTTWKVSSILVACIWVLGGCADRSQRVTANGPIEARTFKPGDQIEVVFVDFLGPGKSDRRVVRVDSRGVIRLQYLGDLYVAGRSEAELEGAILAELQNSKIDQRWEVQVRRVP